MNKILSRALFCLVLMILGTAENAKSANLSVNPSLTVQEIWDSNIFNASYQNEQSDFIFRATPSLTFGVSAWDTTMRIGFSGELDQYYRFKELNSFSATKVFDLGVEKPFQITPRLQVRPMAKFVSTRDAVRRNQIEQVSGSGEFPTTESVVTSRTAVRDYMGGLQISYALTPSLDAGIGGAYMDRRYPENPPGLFDSKTLSGNGSLSYRFTPRFTSGFFAEASKTTYVEKPESQVITVALTSAYEISEVFKGDVKAGASRLEEATTFGTPEERQWVPTGVVGITYHRKDFSTRLESSYGISGGEVTERRPNVVRFCFRWRTDLERTGMEMVLYPIKRTGPQPTRSLRISKHGVEWLESSTPSNPGCPSEFPGHANIREVKDPLGII